MASWVWRMLPRNVYSSAISSENQRVEDCHCHHEAYGDFLPIQTRWQDNDQYDHVNNALCYSYFDTVIDHYLIRLFAVGAAETSPWAGREHPPDWNKHCDSTFQVLGLKTSLLTSPMVGFVVGFMVANQCTFHSPVSFPQVPVAALAVAKVGHSSVHYHLALFPPEPTQELPTVDHRDLSDSFFFGHPKLAQFDALACTTGSSVLVFVNPTTSKPMGLLEDFRRALLRLMRPASM